LAAEARAAPEWISITLPRIVAAWQIEGMANKGSKTRIDRIVFTNLFVALDERMNQPEASPSSPTTAEIPRMEFLSLPPSPVHKRLNAVVGGDVDVGGDGGDDGDDNLPVIFATFC
jgi:hypothetical protein